MLKSFSATVGILAVLVVGGSAFAADENWLVTEENVSGVKGAQGTWAVKIEGNKITGLAALQTDRGGQLSYKIDGSISDGSYTITMNDRSDGKKGCIWSGHAPAGSSTQKQGLIGYAECDGTKLIIRASMAGH